MDSTRGTCGYSLSYVYNLVGFEVAVTPNVRRSLLVILHNTVHSVLATGVLAESGTWVSQKGNVGRFRNAIASSFVESRSLGGRVNYLWSCESRT